MKIKFEYVSEIPSDCLLDLVNDFQFENDFEEFNSFEEIPQEFILYLFESMDLVKEEFYDYNGDVDFEEVKYDIIF